MEGSNLLHHIVGIYIYIYITTHMVSDLLKYFQTLILWQMVVRLASQRAYPGNFDSFYVRVTVSGCQHDDSYIRRSVTD